MSNLEMTPEVVFHSFLWLGACKTWPYTTPEFQRKEKIKIKIKSIMNVWKTCYIEMHGCNLKVKEKEKNA
jgi:hypothetical protein